MNQNSSPTTIPPPTAGSCPSKSTGPLQDPKMSKESKSASKPSGGVKKRKPLPPLSLPQLPPLSLPPPKEVVIESKKVKADVNIVKNLCTLIEMAVACIQSWDGLPKVLEQAGMNPKAKIAIEHLKTAGSNSTNFVIHNVEDGTNPIFIKVITTIHQGERVTAIRHEEDVERVFETIHLQALAASASLAPIVYGSFSCFSCDSFAYLTFMENLTEKGYRSFDKRNEKELEAAGKALQVLHKLGILHQDLNQGNILIRDNDGGFDVRFVDFDMAIPRPKKDETMLMDPAQAEFISFTNF